MQARSADDRRQLRTDRRATGATTAKLSRTTHRLLLELLAVTGLRGMDELLFELVTAELQRRRDLKPAVSASERARLARE